MHPVTWCCIQKLSVYADAPQVTWCCIQELHIRTWCCVQELRIDTAKSATLTWGFTYASSSHTMPSQVGGTQVTWCCIQELHIVTWCCIQELHIVTWWCIQELRMSAVKSATLSWGLYRHTRHGCKHPSGAPLF
jgi:hypothetical protein